MSKAFSHFLFQSRKKALDKSCQVRYNETVQAFLPNLGCVGGQSLLFQERVVHRLLVCPLLFPEGGGDMQSTFQQILLLGGAVGSIVGGVFAVLSYLKSYKKKKQPPSNP